MFPFLIRLSRSGIRCSKAIFAAFTVANSTPTVHKQNSFCFKPVLKYGTKISSRSFLVSKKMQKCDPQGTRPTAGSPVFVSASLSFKLSDKHLYRFVNESILGREPGCGAMID